MRAVLQVFENYQRARVNFVQTVAELATRPQNIEALQNAGVMQLLRPLLLDNVPSIQQAPPAAHMQSLVGVVPPQTTAHQLPPLLTPTD